MDKGCLEQGVEAFFEGELEVESKGNIMSSLEFGIWTVCSVAKSVLWIEFDLH